MDLNHFIAEEKAALERFRQDWMENHVKNPEQYPLDMDLGEWGEMLLTDNG